MLVNQAVHGRAVQLFYEVNVTTELVRLLSYFHFTQ